MSPSNWLFSLKTRSASSWPPLEGPPWPAKLSPSSLAEDMSSFAAETTADFSLFISAENAAWRAFLFLCTSSDDSELSWPWTASWNSLAVDSPTSFRSDGTWDRKWVISDKGRKPQRPSKGVTAIVISGLWLSSALITVRRRVYEGRSVNTRIILRILCMQSFCQFFIWMCLNAQRLSNWENFEQEGQFSTISLGDLRWHKGLIILN